MALDILKTPSSDDLVWKAVDYVLSVDHPTGFSIGLRYFAGIMVIFATAKLAYFIISTIAMAAREGKTIKGSYNEIWGPLAVILGFGLLLPVPGMHGLTSAHFVLRQFVAAPSINTFNAVAIGAADFLIKDGHAITPLAIYGKEFAWSVALSETCFYVLPPAKRRGIGEYIQPKSPASVGNIVESNGKYQITWDWGSECGAISLSDPQDFGAFGAKRRIAAKQLIEDVRALKVHKGIVERLRKVGMTPADVEGYSDERNVEAYKKAGYLVDDLTQQLNEIGAKYERAVADAAAEQATTGQIEQRQKLVDGVRTFGGAVFFSYFRVISQLSEQASTYASEKPYHIVPSVASWSNGTVAAEVQFALRILKNQRTLESKAIKLTGDDLAFAGEQESTIFADALNFFTHPIIDYLTAYDGWRPDPVADLINVGNRMMTGAKLMFAAGLTATGASNFWSSTVGKMVEYGMTPVWPLMMISYVGGIMFSIVLPNLLLIYAIFGITAFVLELIIASIAVIVWAAMHARLDHEGLVNQHNTPGYKIMFGLFLRLPINMLAFLASWVANAVVLNIFLFVWSFGFRGSMGGDAMGVGSIIAAFAISMFVQWKIAVFMFSLNMNLSEKVAQWFGHNSQSMGEATQGAAVVAGIHSNAGTGAPQKPQSKGAPKPKSKDDNPQPQGGGQRNLSTPPAEKTNTQDENQN
ncbi:DotA/TraY family protein [Brucella pseudogrignonensis]|uniref:DotA/TraY family protein n=1 Tax=Brucella pseudogrignonensis TaxID=419475 RepID=UPI0028BA3902|nr:DotA/TraY family protein [Brucella pseudogrignonensis]MDT6939816.1 DotA/TraY family protein [Brucella pseudogrignonensis]